MEAHAPVQTLGKATPKDIQARERYWALVGAKDQPSRPPANESEKNSISNDAGDPEHTFERGRLALRFLHWHTFDKYWYDKRMRYRALNRSREPEDNFVNGLVRLTSIQSPKVPVFYHVLQCMRSSPIEVNKVGNLLFRLLGNKHHRFHGVIQGLSVVQANGLLSLRYLPDQNMHSNPAAFESRLKFAIRINNTVENEDAMIDFMPPINPDELRRIDISDDIINHGFKCIGLLAKADKDFRCGVVNLFTLLVSSIVEQSIMECGQYHERLEIVGANST